MQSLQSALASLGCTSLSGLVCHKHTRNPHSSRLLKHMLMSQGPYSEDVEIYSSVGKDVALKTQSFFLLHAFCNVTLMMLYYISNICYSKHKHSNELLLEQHSELNMLSCQIGSIFKIRLLKRFGKMSYFTLISV